MKIDPRDILLLFRARNEEANLNWFLDHHDEMYNCFVALVDRSNDKTYKQVRSHPKCAAVFEKVHDIGYCHHRDHALLEQSCAFFPHKWIWRLDVDERVSRTFIDELSNLPEGISNVGMRFLTLYPDENHFISGNHKYASLSLITRLFRRVERDHIPRRNDAPVYIANSLVRHYNMMSQMRRENRYATYVRHNPERFDKKEVQTGYEHIINVDGVRSLPLNNCQTISDLYSHLLSLQDLSLTEQKDVQKLIRILTGNRWM